MKKMSKCKHRSHEYIFKSYIEFINDLAPTINDYVISTPKDLVSEDQFNNNLEYYKNNEYENYKNSIIYQYKKYIEIHEKIN